MSLSLSLTVNVLVRPVYEIRVRYWAKLLPALFKSRQERNRVKMEFMKRLCPVGEDPIRFTVSVKNWAGECSTFFSFMCGGRGALWTGPAPCKTSEAHSVDVLRHTSYDIHQPVRRLYHVAQHSSASKLRC